MKRIINDALLAWLIIAIVASGCSAKVPGKGDTSPSPSKELSTQLGQVMVQRDSNNDNLIIYLQ